jgi:uncharacterized RDD family membrane protein YckC
VHVTYPAAPGTTYTFSPTPGAGSPAPDPTSVMGRRTVAWILDFVIYFGLLFLLFTQLAVQDTFGNSCEALQNADVTNVCAEVGDNAYFLDDGSDTTALNLFALGWFVVVYVLLQGITGASPGKFLLGLRVVDEQGKPCGPVKSLIRSVLWIVDAAPWFIPGLVGFVVALTSTGHRRVGDMAASTYVVARSSVGTPIQVGGQQGIPNYAPSGPQSAYGNAWAPNPAAPVSRPPGGSAWTPTPMPPPEPTASAPPVPAIPEATLPEPEPQPETPPAGPQWDADRNTYIQWDADARSWLAWDDADEEWRPI